MKAAASAKDVWLPSLFNVWLTLARCLLLLALFLMRSGQDVSCFLFGLQMQSAQGVPLSFLKTLAVKLASMLCLLTGGLEVVVLLATGRALTQHLFGYEVVVLGSKVKSAATATS